MTIKRHLIHAKSNTPNKIPSNEDIRYGEIAINYNEGNEKIYLKNENDIIQSIQTDSQNDEKFATIQSLSGETQARLDVDTILNDIISANQEDTSAKFDYISSVTDSLQSSAETLTNNLNNYLPLTGGTISGQVSIESDIAPLNVNNTSLNENLNADLLDGVHANELFTSLVNDIPNKQINLTIGNTTKELTVKYATNSLLSDSATTAIKTQGTLTLSGGATATFNGNNNTTVIIPSNDISLGTTGNVTTSISSVDSGITYNKGQLQVVETPTSSGYAKSYKLILDDLQLGETIDIPRNQFLSSVSYDESTKILTFYMILQDGQLQPTNVNLSDLIDVYDSNNGIQKTSGDTGSTFSIKVKNIGNEFLGVDANGVYVTGVTTAINNAVATEANTRETNDNTLNNAITAETASRVSAIDTVNETIATETTNRTNADTTLNNAITAETTSRTNADTTLNNAITAETASRISADDTLHQEIQGITSVTHSVNSDYATNSGSATKLATARNIWGQSFDGTGDINGHIHTNGSIFMNGGYINACNAIAVNFTDTWSDGTNAHPWYGYDARYGPTGIYSTTISNYFGMSFKTQSGFLCLNSSGNVGINTTAPGYTLDVNGSANIGGQLILPNTVPIVFTGSGSGTYNKGTIQVDSTYGMVIETPRVSDSSTATALPLIVHTRGGNPTYVVSHGLIVEGVNDSNYLLRSDGGVSHFNYDGDDVNQPYWVWGVVGQHDYKLFNPSNFGVARSNVAAKLAMSGSFSNTQMQFNWSGQDGQPTWLWGGQDPSNMYVYNPSNFNVNSATKLTTGRTIWGQAFDGSGNVDGTLNIRATTGNWTEGIRLHKSSNGWSTIILCGDDNTGDTGTSVNSWSIHNDNNNCFIIARNSSDATNGLMINQSGCVGIGVTPHPNYKLDVNGTAYINGGFQVEAPSQFNDSVVISDTCTAMGFYESSDRTLKENISLINEEDSKKSENVSLKEFNFKEDEDKVKHYGVIAQEVQEAGLDNLVKEDKDGKLSVDYISLLILKISQLENKVKELEKQINS